MSDAIKRLRAAQPQEVDVRDSAAEVQQFAEAMKAKMHEKSMEGRGGWNDPVTCSVDYLASLLLEHIPKGDPVDIGNFAMMLFHREGGADALRRAAQPPSAMNESKHTQASGVEREIEHLRQQRDQLLAALKAIVSNSMFEQRFDHCGFMNATALSDRDLFRKLWANARDAIEKAEGRSDE